MLFPQKTPNSSPGIPYTTYAIALLLLLSSCNSGEEKSWSDGRLPEATQTGAVKQGGAGGNHQDTTTAASGTGDKIAGKETLSREERDLKFITTLVKQHHTGFAGITQRLITKTTTYKEKDKFALDCINYCCSKVGEGDDEYKRYFDKYTARLLENPDRTESKGYRYLKSARKEINPNTQLFFEASEAYQELFTSNESD